MCVKNYVMFVFLFLSSVLAMCAAQSDAMLPFTGRSLRQFIRSKTPVPEGRKANIADVRILLFLDGVSNSSQYYFSNVKRILSHPGFDLQKPTVVYAHGYVEIITDDSLQTVVEAYTKHGGYNVLVIDWSNLAFGNYILASLNVELVSREAGRALTKLVMNGLNIETLHLVGHSLGAHVVANTARHLKLKNMTVPRITGLDPALPGFYRPLAILGKAISAEDAKFVDVIHTDGGRYGTPLSTGHADFWPNSGQARQPGCPINSILLSYEDFCSHWRSWRFWSESLSSDRFASRPCTDYESFIRGDCADRPIACMGLCASPDLSGNFYLRTAGSTPYALGERGAG